MNIYMKRKRKTEKYMKMCEYNKDKKELQEIASK